MLPARPRRLLLLLPAFLLVSPPVQGEGERAPHDFTRSLSPSGGKCAACHLPHGAAGPSLWSRSLAEERAFFAQSSDPDYRRGGTLLCYDCHDDSPKEPRDALVDDDPKKAQFSTLPLDVAFAGGVQGTVGYYETVPPGDKDDRGVKDPPADGSPTGGHYLKNIPGGIPSGISRGDKLPCGDCHDPHGPGPLENQALLRDELGGRKVERRLTSSPFSRYGEGTGREACAACHGFSDAGDNGRMYGLPLARPPAGFSWHREGDDTPCVSPLCHPHDNPAAASCGSCHGFPPATGAHQAHAALPPQGPGAFCDACHGPGPGAAPWHNQGKGTVEARNVDIREAERGAWGPEPSYGGVPFPARGVGGNGSCTGLACHGDPPGPGETVDGGLRWTDRAAEKTVLCSWCHDLSSSRVPGFSPAANVMGDGSALRGYRDGAAGFALLGHGRRESPYPLSGNPPAGLACPACHRPDGDHLGGKAGDRLLAGREALCFLSGCHDQGGVSVHSNRSGGNFLPRRPAFTVYCLTCHEPHGLTARDDGWGGIAVNRLMVRPLVAGRTVALAALAGTDGFDESDGGGANNGDDLCAVCHTRTDHNSLQVAQAGNGHHEGEDCSPCHPHDFDGAALTGDGFMDRGCEGSCHGLPPADAGHRPHCAENAPLPAGPGLPCASCHGPDPGFSSWHNQGKGTILPSNVDIRAPWGPLSGTALAGSDPNGWGAQARYGGAPLPAAGDGSWSCQGLDCHGKTDVTADPASVRCRDCHDATPSRFTSTWVMEASSAAAAWEYTGPVPGYGGHGDPDMLVEVLDCLPCHDPEVSHFPGPSASSNPCRLGTPFLGGSDRLEGTCLARGCHYRLSHAHKSNRESGTLKAPKVPPDSLPLYPHLTSGSYSNRAGDRVVCTTCHQLHGVFPPPLGDQTTMTRKSWRSPDAICLNCHP